MKVFIVLLLVAGAVESTTALDRPDCDKAPETGPCRGHFPRYYYDQEAGQCKKFVYGGCGGNGNNFKTEDECYNQCGAQCGQNAHYEECGKPRPLTCNNYDNPPKFCRASCVKGCQCDEGFVKAENGSCVKPEDCPVKRNDELCGDNERYNDCGTACPLTCENYDNPPEVCNFMCWIGCECQEGFVRRADGKCVMPDQCPNGQAPISRIDCIEPKDSGRCSASFQRYYYDPETNDCKTFTYGGCGGNRNNFETREECYDECGVKCGENAHYEECGKPRPLTCDNYDNPPKFCPASCVSGCDCNEGFVKAENGSCVKPEDCPVKRNDEVCGENERFSECATACPLTCENYDNPPKICPAFCRIGCECEKGFIRNQDGRCVRYEECTNRQAAQNECSGPPLTGPCRTFFTRYHYNPSTDKCSDFIYGGCRGNKNNFKTEAECNGKCREKCGENEHFVVCRRRCPLTCGNYENPPACVAMCAAGGCQCKEGFVRTKNRSCVKPEKCPVKRNQTRPDCPPNKEYGSFGDCPVSCYSLDHPGCPSVHLRLNWGCKCKPGYVLKEDKVFDSDCIKPEKCPKHACNE